MTAGRYMMGQRWIEQLVADRLLGDPLRVVVDRCGRSISWIRSTLARIGVPLRPRVGDREPDETGNVVRLRDEECLTSANAAGRVSPSEVVVLLRNRNAGTDVAALGSNRPGASADEPVWRQNDAIDHLDEIRAAYWAGSTIGELADRWGVSQKTITTWIYRV